MSKEEIIKSFHTRPMPMKDIIEAMDMYARERHFEFKKWINEIITNPTIDQDDYNKFTDEQLWDIFTNS